MSGSTATREQVMSALFTKLTSGVLATTWATSSRRLQLWSDVPLQPALFLTDHDEEWEQKPRGMPQRLTMMAQAVVYAKTNDPSETPSIVLNGLLQLIDQAMQPDNFAVNANTLGGLVSHCWIAGRVFKDPGDLDGQALAILPINILFP